MDDSYSSKGIRSSYLSSIISISLVLFMLGLLGILVIDARKISKYVKEHVQLNIYLKDDINEAELSAFENLLLKAPYARSIQYISKSQALDSLKKDLGEDALRMLEINPLPASFELKMYADYTHPDSLKQIAHSIQKNSFIREVSYHQTEVERMNENFRTVAIVLILFLSLLLVIAIALINSAIRLAMHSRRFLIKSMQLVGATKGFIRKPFLLKSIIHGFWSGLIACILLSGLLYMVRTKLPELVRIQDMKVILILFGAVIFTGMVLSFFSTFFAVNRYLRLKIEELYG